MFKYSNNKTGFTLLELMITIFVVSVGLVGAISVIVRTLTVFSYSASKLTAAYLAQEGIEIVRNMRDGNWLEEDNDWKEGLTPTDDDPTNCSGGCEVDYNDPVLQPYGAGHFLKNNAAGFYDYTPTGDDTKFKRKITINEILPDEISVLVEVSWSERGCPVTDCRFSAQENLYNWFQR